MRRRSLVIAAMIILTLALATLALAADPFVGTWKLNVAKSKVSDPGMMPKSEIFKAEALDNGIKRAYEGVEANGKAYKTVVSARYDEKDYPVTGGVLDPVTGSSFVDTEALKKIDATAFEYVDKKAGKEVAIGRVAVSKDGKTLTHTLKVTNPKGLDLKATWIYDKQ